MRTPPVGAVVFGSLSEAAHQCSSWVEESKYTVVVLDVGLAQTSAGEELLAAIERAAIGGEIFVIHCEGEPMASTVKSAAEQVLSKSFRAHSVLALGGGSAIDTGKLLALLLANGERELPATFTSGLSGWRPPLRLAVVVSTAGTGAEVSPAAVYSASGRKTALVADQLVPALAIVVAELLATLPRQQALYSAFDGIAHSLEGLLSTRANHISDALHNCGLNSIVEGLGELLNGGMGVLAARELSTGSLASGLGARIAGANIIHTIAGPVADARHVRHGRAIARATLALLEGLPAWDSLSARRLASKISGPPTLERIETLLRLTLTADSPLPEPSAPELEQWLRIARATPLRIEESQLVVSDEVIVDWMRGMCLC